MHNFRTKEEEVSLENKEGQINHLYIFFYFI